MFGFSFVSYFEDCSSGYAWILLGEHNGEQGGEGFVAEICFPFLIKQQSLH